MALCFSRILIMVCNTAILVHNQTGYNEPMQLIPLSCWVPLMTEPWINGESCEPTEEGDPSCLVAAAPNNLCLLLGTTAVNQQISFWARTNKWRIIGQHQQPQLGSGSEVSWTRSKTPRCRFHFTPTSSFITVTIWNLAPSVWAFPHLHLFPVFHFPLITSSLLKVSESSTYLFSNLTATKTHFKIKSACSAMLLRSPLRTPPQLSFPHFTHALCLSFRRADAT